MVTVLPSSVPAAETAWTDLAVRVYDSTDEPAGDRRAALTVAASILSATSIEVIWTECEWTIKRASNKAVDATVEPHAGPAGGGRCDVPLQHRELSIRIVRQHVPAGDPRTLPLGDAIVDPKSGAGVLATIYLDRVWWVAEQSGVDRRMLLGRAIAHELGHLLMATTGHGASGLMRAFWSRDEMRRHRTSDWVFGPPEIAAIRARAARR